MKKAILSVVCLFFMFSCTKDKGAIPIISVEFCDTIKYSTNVAAIITTKCASASGCHEAGSGSGDFTTYDGVKTKIGLNSDPFNTRVFVTGDMPLTGSLTNEEKQQLRCWLDAGAPNN